MKTQEELETEYLTRLRRLNLSEEKCQLALVSYSHGLEDAHARATPHSDWRQGGIGEVEAACMETHEMIDAVRLKNITALTAERDTLQSSLDKLTSERDELKKLLGEAVDTINGVQNLIRGFTTNSSEILAPVKEAWNVNARFLNKAWEQQNEYLLRAAGRGKGGEDV